MMKSVRLLSLRHGRGTMGMRLLGARMKSSSPLQQSVESLTKSTNNPVSSKASMPFVNSKDQKLTVSAVQNNPGSKLAFEFSNLVELVHKACDHYRNDNLFGTKVGNTFEWIKFGDFGREVQRFRNVLSHLKFGYNDKIALISNNRVEWAVAACAAQSLGGQIVPMYEAQLDKDWRYIVEDSGASIVLVSTEKIYEKTSSYVGQVGQVRTVLCMDASAEYMHSYKRRMKTVETETAVDVFPVTSDDLCTIIYTSGTTGKPKGVLLTHGNIASNLKGMEQLWSGKLKKEVSLAFLPWAHVFGQTCEFYAAFREGNSMGIVNKEAILESLDIVKPTILISVPALFNKVYDGVMKKVSQGSPISKTIFKTAMSISRRRNKLLEFGKPVPFLLNLQFKFFDKIVFEKIRARFGGRLKFMASGGAAISLTILEFFEDISIPVCTGYGLTETSPVVTSCNSDWSTRRLGTCGVLLSDVSVIFIDPNTLEEVPVGQDGEVCVAGPLVMRGYHNNPEASDEVFMMKNGKKYFKTGDLGHMEDGKFLKITGRIKEQFKLENGKYVVPIPVEDDMCRSLFIHQAILYGDNRKYTVLLVVPEWSELRAWAIRSKIPGVTEATTPEGLMTESAVISLLASEIEGASLSIKSYERPARFDIIIEPFSPENQMLTPKLSIRRNNVFSTFKVLIDSLYTAEGGYKLKVSSASKADNEM